MARAILMAAVMLVVCAALWAASAANWLSRHLRLATGARPARQV
jgi:Ca2+/Na+ antiporter